MALSENPMRKTRIKLIASAFLLRAAFPCLNGYAQAQAAKARYPAMALSDSI